MSVIGIDIGNDNCVIAVARQRGIDVVLNDESKRETPSAVSFADKNRLLGSSASASAARNPRSSISHLKRLLCLRGLDDERELRFLPFDVAPDGAGGVSVRVRCLGEDRLFSPAQVLAMLLSHLKQIAERDLEAPVSTCVLGVPSYFTDEQRRAYVDAASIAGLSPLSLMHDCAATALGYGIYRTDFPKTGGPMHVAFVDVGHCDTQVCVAAFEAGKMRVLSHASDARLGGRDFDEVLFDHFAEQFKNQYGIDVCSNARATVRLRSACEKLKRVLSANAEAPINIECLMDEIDVKGFIKREEFERLSLGLLERIVVPCKRAVADAGLTLNGIHSVEIVGSGSRIPAIARMVGGFFKKEPRRTLNASECVARGCALQCAMLSPVFRVRDYEVQDSFPFTVGFSLEGDSSMSSNNVLFPKGQPIPSVKILSFHRSSTFNIEVFYTDPSQLPAGASPKISSFTVGPFQASCSGKPKVKVRVRLNLHGIISIESASLIDDVMDGMGTPNSNMDNADHEFASRGPDSATNPVENGTSTHSEGMSHPIVDGHENQTSKVDGARRGRTSRRLEIPVTENKYGGMTKSQISDAQEMELQLAHQDWVVEQTKDRKNALEAYVYEIRNKLLEKYRSFATESEREGISRSLQQTEEWLYEDGDDESENVYTGKLKELKKLVDPIENRYRDEESRAQAIRDLLNCIVDYRIAVKSLATPDRDMVINECIKAEQWLRETTQLQDSLPKNIDPVLWSSEIRRRTEALDAACCHVIGHKASPARAEDRKAADQHGSSDNMRDD
ncbi:Heat shock 70 kDa protein 16 [Acorus gramineus]|uniref:Heat shock 70 kDa protein 16 n=1 Tax=Acorus gramineus TaxID=55184 RepID=A0AAV9BZ46_ACOGR|nr:Heat shock 70 kDa protein 16 [Acorus gramineus]